MAENLAQQGYNVNGGDDQASDPRAVTVADADDDDEVS